MNIVYMLMVYRAKYCAVKFQLHETDAFVLMILLSQKWRCTVLLAHVCNSQFVPSLGQQLKGITNQTLKRNVTLKLLHGGISVSVLFSKLSIYSSVLIFYSWYLQGARTRTYSSCCENALSQSARNNLYNGVRTCSTRTNKWEKGNKLRSANRGHKGSDSCK